MGNNSNSRIIHVLPKAGSELGYVDYEANALQRIGRGVKIKSPASALEILRSLDLLTAFIGNVVNTQYHTVSVIGLVLWIFNIAASFSFDSYEAYAKYGYVWVTIKGAEWGTFCLGTYYLICRTMPWMREGLLILEGDGRYNETLSRVSVTFKKIQFLVVLFAVIGASIQYTILRLDKADHVTFNQTAPTTVLVLLHACRFASGFHVLYAYGLFWFVPGCVMLMTGHSMVEYQQRIRAQLRRKDSSLTFREAVRSFDERVRFVRKSSQACLVLLMLLLILTLLSVMINAYVYLYKNRYHIYIWHALMPLALAVYPMCTAAWVTKQYHWYFIVVVKAWVERPEESDSDSGSEPPLEERVADMPGPEDAGMRIHVPTTGHVTIDESVAEAVHETVDKSAAEARKQRLRRVLKGSVRTMGSWQRTRKLTAFNFEKYISYLNNVAPTTGFKISTLTVTWEIVSASMFLIISVVAVFVQETIFGDQKPKL